MKFINFSDLYSNTTFSFVYIEYYMRAKISLLTYIAKYPSINYNWIRSYYNNTYENVIRLN
jgi:hypothetical protein